MPPKGTITLPAPIVESNISTIPFWLATFSSFKFSSHNSLILSLPKLLSYFELTGSVITAFVFCLTPFVSKKSLPISSIVLPLHVIFSLLSSVTSATTVDSRFSSWAYLLNSSTSSFLITTAILSWDSDIANSVPSSPSYFTVTISKFIFNPSANSPMATETPPAPKSLHFFISILASFFLNNLWMFLSIGAFPFGTSIPIKTVVSSSVCFLEEAVAPPIPSLPVLPPKSITTSPFIGVSLITFSRGAAAITAPASNLLAT